MAFQKEVHARQAIGQPGMVYDASHRRVTVYTLGGVTVSDDTIGRVFTFDANGDPQLGGTGAFAGILCHPNALARIGLDPQLGVREGTPAELADKGRIIVRTTAAAAKATKVQYSTASGEITGTAPATPGPGMAVLEGAEFFMFDAGAGELAVVQIS